MLKNNEYIFSFPAEQSGDHFFSFRITGRSMFPVIVNNDIVLVDRSDRDEIKNGDIIVFRSLRNIICHRITGTGLGQDGKVFFWAKGDFNFVKKERVYPEAIIGKVCVVYRGERKLFIPRQGMVQGIAGLAALYLKQFCLCSAEFILGKRCFRNILKKTAPLDPVFQVVNDSSLKERFDGFMNGLPFSRERFTVAAEFLTFVENKTVAKLWGIREISTGQSYLYGPYVKLFYRGRYAGKRIVEAAIEFLRGEFGLDSIGVFIPERNRGLYRLYSSLGFLPVKTSIQYKVLLKKVSVGGR